MLQLKLKIDVWINCMPLPELKTKNCSLTYTRREEVQKNSASLNKCWNLNFRWQRLKPKTIPNPLLASKLPRIRQKGV
jgi:hypothetical protein